VCNLILASILIKKNYVFFQGWIAEHFPDLSVWRYDANYNEGMPQCAKYIPEQAIRIHLDIDKVWITLKCLTMLSLLMMTIEKCDL
jgi:hypothetical protein